MSEFLLEGKRETIVIDASKWSGYGGNAVVRRRPQEYKSHDGLALPDRYEKNIWVQVVSVGKGRIEIPDEESDTGYFVPNGPASRGDWCICRQFEGHLYKKWHSSDGWEYAIVDTRVLEARIKPELYPKDRSVEVLEDDFESFGKFGIGALEVLGNYVYILRDKLEEKTGAEKMIWIPEVSQDIEPGWGEVVAVGEGPFDKWGKRVRPDFGIGDRISFSVYGGYPTRLPDFSEYWQFEQNEILGKELRETEGN